jgi:hypothetical protein
MALEKRRMAKAGFVESKLRAEALGFRPARRLTPTDLDASRLTENQAIA